MRPGGGPISKLKLKQYPPDFFIFYQKTKNSNNHYILGPKQQLVLKDKPPMARKMLRGVVTMITDIFDEWANLGLTKESLEMCLSSSLVLVFTTTQKPVVES